MTFGYIPKQGEACLLSLLYLKCGWLNAFLKKPTVQDDTRQLVFTYKVVYLLY